MSFLGTNDWFLFLEEYRKGINDENLSIIIIAANRLSEISLVYDVPEYSLIAFQCQMIPRLIKEKNAQKIFSNLKSNFKQYFDSIYNLLVDQKLNLAGQLTSFHQLLDSLVGCSKEAWENSIKDGDEFYIKLTEFSSNIIQENVFPISYQKIPFISSIWTSWITYMSEGAFSVGETVYVLILFSFSLYWEESNVVLHQYREGKIEELVESLEKEVNEFLRLLKTAPNYEPQEIVTMFHSWNKKWRTSIFLYGGKIARKEPPVVKFEVNEKQAMKKVMNNVLQGGKTRR